MYVDVFQDGTGVTGLTNVSRNSDGEYLSAVTQSITSAAFNQTNRTAEGLVVSFNNITPDGNFTGNPIMQMMYGLITAHQPIVHLQMKTGIFKLM